MSNIFVKNTGKNAIKSTSYQYHKHWKYKPTAVFIHEALADV